MSLLNPGKRGIYTLLSVLLIIGIPGIIAYADSSTDTYYSIDEQEPGLDSFKVNNTTFGFTSAYDGDRIDIAIDSVAADEETQLSSMTAVTQYVVLDYGAFPNGFGYDKIVVSSDLDLTGVEFKFVLTDSTYRSIVLEYDEANDCFFYEFSSLELVDLVSAPNFWLYLAVESSEAVSSFWFDIDIYSKETVFTDDVVELIVLVGGILLLVLGTMALSFFDVTTPGKAFRSAGRSVRNITRRK